MTPLALLLLVMAAFFAVANWVSRIRDDHRLEYVTKPATTALLVAVALAIDADAPGQQLWFAGGLVLALAGDVALMLPADRFLGGLAAFLAAHVAFLVGFAVAGIEFLPFLAAATAVAVLSFPVTSRIVRALRATGRGRLLLPVGAYMAAIALLVAGAVAVRSPVAIAGAVMFLVSDGLLAWDRFVQPLSWAGLGVMVTYHGGVTGLVLSLAPTLDRVA